MDALSAQSAAESVAESAERLRKLPERAYNPFNLLMADSQEAFVLSYRDVSAVRTLSPGAHVIGNTDPEDRDAPKVTRILEQANKAALHGSHSVLDELASICGDHTCSEHGSPEGPLGDACVHTELYGTRSSTLLLLAERESRECQSTLLFADGHPCRTEYRDFTSLLPELSRPARYGSGETLAREHS